MKLRFSIFELIFISSVSSSSNFKVYCSLLILPSKFNSKRLSSFLFIFSLSFSNLLTNVSVVFSFKIFSIFSKNVSIIFCYHYTIFYNLVQNNLLLFLLLLPYNVDILLFLVLPFLYIAILLFHNFYLHSNFFLLVMSHKMHNIVCC